MAADGVSTLVDWGLGWEVHQALPYPEQAHAV